MQPNDFVIPLLLHNLFGWSVTCQGQAAAGSCSFPSTARSRESHCQNLFLFCLNLGHCPAVQVPVAVRTNTVICTHEPAYFRFVTTERGLLCFRQEKPRHDGRLHVTPLARFTHARQGGCPPVSERDTGLGCDTGSGAEPAASRSSAGRGARSTRIYSVAEGSAAIPARPSPAPRW